ncbi:DeoR/GlpR family DNA-binding transcription regulator [Neobacillus sp. NPDC058068]|uniref:DeoR/GlpR family DNA-binding transcription regulator n=1 Tax=Neobacillus sp. NPDC058068 TaxID=3346325 RepID=UPI0036DBD94C
MNKKKVRQNEIISKLKIKDVLSVEEIAATFNITEATVRRDLEELEQEGHIVRIHGGARISQEDPSLIKTFKERTHNMIKEKERIADKVAALIPDHSIITLDNGTTAWLVAKRLKQKKDLTIVTNSLLILDELIDTEGIHLLMAGGTFRKRNYDFIGEKAVHFLSDIYSDIAVLTCDSFRPGLGFYKLSEASAEIAKAAVHSSKKVIVLADHTKLNATGSHRYLIPEKVDSLFTDCNMAQSDKNLLQSECYKTIYC